MTARRQTLVSTALDLFGQRGIDGVSMDDIARGAGVTKGSLYWHFDTKREVILEAAALYYEVWRASMQEVIGHTESHREALEAAIAYSVQSCLLEPNNRVFTTELIALSLHDDEFRASWAGFYDEALRLFLGLTHRAVGSGQMVCDDVDTRVDLMLAAMEGLKQTALFSPAVISRDREQRLCNQLFDLLCPTETATLAPGRAAAPPLRL
jgi:AcrR family transcriptional regulator